MRLSEIGGENGLVERLREIYGGKGGGLAVGIGDDAAVIDPSPGKQWVVSTDLLVEGTHFRRDWSDFYSIGWKAAASNLSDLAAMGAEPGYAFLSLGLPPDIVLENVDRLMDGFSDCLNRSGAKLAGGDTVACARGLVINVCVIGLVETGKAWTRTGARVGDWIFVSGTIGDAAGGLRLLEQFGPARADKLNRALLSAHRRPAPRLPLARALAAEGAPRAAMDLSDGLLSDLPRLCAASKVGARLDLSRLPISDELEKSAAEGNYDPLLLALEGGEDYELLLCVSPDEWKGREDVLIAGTPLTRIGEIVRSGIKVAAPDGTEADLSQFGAGWRHFPA